VRTVERVLDVFGVAGVFSVVRNVAGCFLFPSRFCRVTVTDAPGVVYVRKKDAEQENRSLVSIR